MASSVWAGLYRNREELAKVRLAELFASADERSHRALSSRAAGVYTRRSARAAAGIMGTIGGVAMLAVSALSLAYKTGEELNEWVLAVAWAATAATYLVARVDGAWRLRRGMASLVGLTEDVDRDLARLEGVAPRRYVRECAESLGRVSIGAPMMAIALLGPLTLHYVVFGIQAREFGEWMAFSAAVVGHAHLVLAFVSWRFAKRLFAGESKGTGLEGIKALGWTTLTAAIPGALLFLLPPVLTFATGLFVVMPAFFWAHRRASAEHALLHAAS